MLLATEGVPWVSTRCLRCASEFLFRFSPDARLADFLDPTGAGDEFLRSNGIALGNGPLEFQAQARSGKIGFHFALDWLHGPVEKQMFDSRVIVEILEMPDAAKSATRMKVNRRGSM